jgi:hypothetical protein
LARVINYRYGDRSENTEMPGLRLCSIAHFNPDYSSGGIIWLAGVAKRLIWRINLSSSRFTRQSEKFQPAMSHDTPVLPGLSPVDGLDVSIPELNGTMDWRDSGPFGWCARFALAGDPSGCESSGRAPERTCSTAAGGGDPAQCRPATTPSRIETIPQITKLRSVA